MTKLKWWALGVVLLIASVIAGLSVWDEVRSSQRNLAAAQETLLWLKDKHGQTVVGCRLADAEKVRSDKSARLNDVVLSLKGTNNSFHLSAFLRADADAELADRLERLDLGSYLLDTEDCSVWIRAIESQSAR